MSAEDRVIDELAAGQIDAIDLDILRKVGAAYDAADGVPPSLVDRVKFGITLDALEAEIAQLQRMELSAVGTRSDGATEEVQIKTVTFSSETLTVMVTVTPTMTDKVRIDGWIAPGAHAVVEARLSAETRSLQADEDGRFVIEDVPRGLVKFVIRPRGGGAETTVVTPSMEI